MATPDLEAPQDRKKKTVWLLAGGAASLLIPLAGAIYLHVRQNAGSSGPSGRSDIFERREGGDAKIIPTQSAVLTTPPALTAPPPSGIGGAADKPAESSLDFIKSNADMQARIADSKAAVSAGPPPASTAPVAAPPAAPAAKKAAKSAKAGKKAFVMPKLQPARGFTNFGSTGANGAAAQTGAAGGQSAQDILKNLPPGSENNPQVQAYLKAHQGN